MIKYLSKVLYVITGSRKQLITLIFAFILTSVLEAVGIGLIGPFMKFASEPESIHQSPFIESIYRQLDLQSSRQFILILGLSVIGIFLVKSVFYFFCKMYIFKFSFSQKRLLSTRLLRSYLALPYTFHLNRNTSNIITRVVPQ